MSSSKPSAPSKAKPIKLPKSLPRPWSYGCVGGAFECGDYAYGMRFLQNGFGRTPDDDKLFALGYPYLVMPIDIEVDINAFMDKAYPYRNGAWPRAIIERFLTYGTRREAGLYDAAVPPLDFAKIAPRIVWVDTPYGDVWLYMLEAIFGSQRTLETAVSAWEQIDDWSPLDGFGLPNAVPFMLLRVDDKTRAALLKRLAAVHAHAAKQFKYEASVVAALARAAGLPETEHEYWTLPYGAPGDKTTIATIVKELATLKPADRAIFDSRLAFLGGATTTKALAEAVAASRFHSSWIKAIVEQLPRLQHPAIAAAMQHLATKSKDADAKAWVAEQ